MAHLYHQTTWAKSPNPPELVQSTGVPTSREDPHIQEQRESQALDRPVHSPSIPISPVSRHYGHSESMSSWLTTQNDDRSTGQMKSNANSIHFPQIPQPAQLSSSHAQLLRQYLVREDFCSNDNTRGPVVPRVLSNSGPRNPPRTSFHWQATVSEASTEDRDKEDVESQTSSIPTLLGAAIIQGINRASMQTAQTRYRTAPTNPGLSASTRMPFMSASGASPASVYTTCSIPDHKCDSVPISVFAQRQTEPDKDFFASRPPQFSSIRAREVNTTLRPLPLREFWTPQSLKSSNSSSPLPTMGIGKAGMSGKISSDKRPANLDMEAVRNMESRGSTTSLAELIRRATRLASNLDRGKTASRYGRFNMSGDDEKSLYPYRESTYSDVLAAFPSPALGSTPPNGRSRANARRVIGQRSSNQDGSSGKRIRQCCGLPLLTFIMFTTIIVLLVATAVLVPIFLILIPKQNASPTNTKNCARSFPCQNGISVVVSNLCSCVCTNGYTGSQCYTATDPECTTSTIVDGSNSYNNATLGDSILPVLSSGPTDFGIPLNVSVLLSTFARNNLSCASENSLVDLDFATSTSQRKSLESPETRLTARKGAVASDLSKPRHKKRLFIVEGLDRERNRIAALSVPSRTIPVVPSKHVEMLKVRQTPDSTFSTNSIVFASSTTTSAQATNVQNQPLSGVSSSTSTSHLPATASSYTTQQLNFAKVVVLYVLEEFEAIGLAVTANQAIERYFRAGGTASGNSTVQFPGVNGTMTADFTQFKISTANGQTIGGAAS